MPFGLCNAPATIQRLMSIVCKDQLSDQCLVYLDDIILHSATFEDHLKALEGLLTKLRSAGLTAKASKC